MKQKLLASAMALAMVLSLTPVTALAALHFNPTIFPQIVHNVPGGDRMVFI